MTTPVSASSTSGATGEAVPLLEVRGVSVRFGGIVAVSEVNLSIDATGCVGMIGPNGAGKTTLLDAMGALRQPTRGRVLLDGVDVTKKSSTWLARNGVRRTFQRHQAFGWLTVEENVLVALEWQGRSRNIARDLLRTPGRRRQTRELLARVDGVIERCGLSDVRTKPAASLPIGQVRLLEFARAIVDRPRLLLLDEPTSGLGSAETELLGEIIRDVTRTECAAVLVEHDLDFVMGLCDRVVVLDQGTVLADDTAAAVRNDPAVVSAYIGDR